MALTFVSIDNNATDRLFPKDGFHPKDLVRTVRDRRLHLSYTEDSLAEALSGPKWAYERLLRIAEFADLAGSEWFSVTMGLKALIDEELKFNDDLARPRFPRYTAELHADFFSRLSERAAFDHWYQGERAENARWRADAERRLSKAQADRIRVMSYEQFARDTPQMEAAALGKDLPTAYGELAKKLATTAGTEAFLGEEIAKIPNLASNWVIEMLVKKSALRRIVTPERCPALAAYAGALSLNRCAAALGVKGNSNRYRWLAPAKNDYTDARIIAQAAYADVLVSEDNGLCRRAELLRKLNLLRPEVMSWDQLLAKR